MLSIQWKFCSYFATKGRGLNPVLFLTDFGSCKDDWAQTGFSCMNLIKSRTLGITPTTMAAIYRRWRIVYKYSSNTTYFVLNSPTELTHVAITSG